jgi:UDP-N-acetylglucosamine--N-acetylmuramyl-(pentapeptide) pyrophosphoryl-undecaprenol N-acetylglucosamine transferase
MSQVNRQPGSQRSILVMAGGTGGHIFPALAVADILRGQNWQVTWLGAPNSMEAELVAKYAYPMALVNFKGLRGKGLLRWLLLPFNLAVALWQSAQAIIRYRPDVVLGMGGYITFPGGLMSVLLRRPLVIHEQNSVAGLSNKLLSKLATRVLSGFPNVLPRAIWCGNPVRQDINKLDATAERYASRTGRLNVLVVGGSLGARAINEVMPYALAKMAASIRPAVLHQTGKHDYAGVVSQYQAAGVEAKITAFIDDMSAAYATADLVICRSGALTIAELAAAGVASLLIPYPFAVDDHQTHNARFLSEKNAAILMPQSGLNTDTLANLLTVLTRDTLLKMAQLAHSCAKVDAAEKVAALCSELVDTGRGAPDASLQ